MVRETIWTMNEILSSPVKGWDAGAGGLVSVGEMQEAGGEEKTTKTDVRCASGAITSSSTTVSSIYHRAPIYSMALRRQSWCA